MRLTLATALSCLAPVALVGCGGDRETSRAGTVRVVFCMQDLCPHAVTRAQIDATIRRATASPMVEDVTFISREEALEEMRRKHPQAVELLPENPLPDTLLVVPRGSHDVEDVAALFSAGPTSGILDVQYREELR